MKYWESCNVNGELHPWIQKKGLRAKMIKRSANKEVLPNTIHPIGGKIDYAEDPFLAAHRELLEETGLKAKNVKLEAVVTEVLHPEDAQYKTPWLVFHFSGDYDGGEVQGNEEGEFVWLTKEQILSSYMFPSAKEVMPYVLDENTGTVFARFEYDKDRNIMNKDINVCVK